MPSQTASTQRVLRNGLLVTMIDHCSKGFALGVIIACLGITGEQLGLLWSKQVPHLFSLHNLQIILLTPAVGAVLGIAIGAGIYAYEKCAMQYYAPPLAPLE